MHLCVQGIYACRNKRCDRRRLSARSPFRLLRPPFAPLRPTMGFSGVPSSAGAAGSPAEFDVAEFLAATGLDCVGGTTSSPIPAGRQRSRLPRLAHTRLIHSTSWTPRCKPKPFHRRFVARASDAALAVALRAEDLSRLATAQAALRR